MGKKSLKPLFNILEPTQENRNLVQRWMSLYGDSARELDAFCLSPLGRIQKRWSMLGGSGVTIFTCAGISGISPRLVRRYLREPGMEPAISGLAYCGNTGLPVLSRAFYPQPTRSLPLSISHTADRVEGRMVKVFSTHEWKKWATRIFKRPYYSGELTREEWSELWQA